MSDDVRAGAVPDDRTVGAPPAVLVLTDGYPPAATGGYERSCADVVARWRRAGWSVTVLTTPAAVPPGAGVERVLPRVDPAGPAPDAAARRASREAVVAALRRVRPDVVSVWNTARLAQADVLGVVAAAGVATVVVACDGWLGDAPAALAGADRLPPGSAVAWVSAALRDATLPRLPAWAPAEHTVVGSGIAAEVFRSRAARARPWRGRLLHVGRLSPAKGVDDAVAALPHLPPDVVLHVVGAGTEDRWEALHNLARRLGVAHRVTTARVDRADLPTVYADADVLLFPSRWAEPFGLVPLEAMACGTPVVATGTGGSGSYLADGRNALVVPPHAPAALAGAVRRLAASPALRGRLARHGVRTSRGHTIDRAATALAGVHRRAASAAP